MRELLTPSVRNRCHKLLRPVVVASARHPDLSVRVRQTLSPVFDCPRVPCYIFQSPKTIYFKMKRPIGLCVLS